MNEQEESPMISDQKMRQHEWLIDGDNYVLIEKFMNRKLSENYDGAFRNDGSRPNVMVDWNYFIPVLEKIESEGCIVELSMCLGKLCRITKINAHAENMRISHESNSTIEAVYSAVAEYTRWKNKTAQ
jgi:hypothetical protein